MAEQQRPVRRGVPKNITLDDEAAQFLVERAPEKTQGRFVSSLLLAERARDEERKRLREGVEKVFAAAAP